MCRSRRELSNEYLLAKIGVDTAENEPLEVWAKIQFTIHFTPYPGRAGLLRAAERAAAVRAVGLERRADRGAAVRHVLLDGASPLVRVDREPR